jgi:glycosyltransferase involved in cell wall biosynthesis
MGKILSMPNDTSHSPALSLALPAYNEAGNIESVLRDSVDALNQTGRSWEILVIDNHSNDNTPELVRAFSVTEPRVRLIVHEMNRYYSGSCQTALDQARGTYLMIMDSDGQFTARDLPVFLEELDAGEDFVMGWRHRRRDPLPRILTSALFNAMGKAWLGYPFHDLNCGIRMINRKMIDASEIKHTINMANPELFVRARLAGGSMTEVKVSHFERKAGTTSHNFLKSWRLFVQVNRYMKALHDELKTSMGHRSGDRNHDPIHRQTETEAGKKNGVEKRVSDIQQSEK